MRISFQDIRVMDLVQIKASASYEGLVTEIEDNGLWITEDDLTEEFVSCGDIAETKLIYRLVRRENKHEK